MASYAALQQIDVFDSRERDGIIYNERFISYYEVESVLHDYPKVLEAGIVVKSLKEDHQVLKVIKVCLTLNETFFNEEAKEEYCREVESFIRYSFNLRMPISVCIREKLPITKSGKILRSVLLDL